MALDHNILLETGTNEFEIVEFIIHSGKKKHHFCINVAKVREVIRFPEIVKVPDAHPSIIGTANIRQNLVPIINLAHWLDLKYEFDTSQCKVVVTYFNHQYNGFLVDEVVRIHRITWADIKDYSAITDFRLVETVLGVVDIGGSLIQLLDFEKIVAEINPDTSITETYVDGALQNERYGKVVFVAEDSSVIRRMLVNSFIDAGYTVKAFENGKLLLDAIEQETPDIVVTDLEMPNTGGAYVVKVLREQSKFDKTPIIVFSSMASEENERKLLGIGANQFIGKPEMGILVNAVDAYLIK